MIVGLFVWGFVQSFAVGLIIPLVKKARNNYLLSLIFFTVSFNILFQYLLRYQDLKTNNPYFLIVPDILDLMLPVMVWIYISNIMGRYYDKRTFLYFILPAVWSVVLIIYTLTTKNFGFDVYIGSTFHRISLGVIAFWKLFILFKAISLFKFQDKSLKKKQSDLMVWPKVLVLFIGLLTFIAFSNLTYWLLIENDNQTDLAKLAQQLIEVNYVVFTCSIILITIFFSFKYPKILSGLPVIKSLETTKFPEGEKYAMELNSLFAEKKVHLDTELNEKKLAEELGVHSYILSRLLNDHMGKSFSEFVNEKRIEEAKRILENQENKDLTIFAVAVDSGFRSESVFYVNFKKFTGQTPNQYKNQFK